MNAKNYRFRYPRKSNDLVNTSFPLMVTSLKNELESMSTEFKSLLVVIENLEGVAQLDIERGVDLREEVRRFETSMIRLALRCAGNQLGAAELLQLKPTTLNAKIKKYGIS